MNYMRHAYVHVWRVHFFVRQCKALFHTAQLEQRMQTAPQAFAAS